MKTKENRTCFIIGLALATALATAGGAHAATLLDTGLNTFAATGEQYGHLILDQVPSDWSEAKPFPGIEGAPDPFGYQTVTVNPGDRPYIQIMFDDSAAAFLVSAYGTAFAPENVEPTYGLDVNYLGDAGSSGNFYGNPQFFQLYDPGLEPLVLVITEMEYGGGKGREFALLVEGFYDREYSEVPEPSTLLLVGVGLGGMALLRRKGSMGSAGEVAG